MGAAELRSDIVQTESVWTLTTTWMQSRSAFDSDRFDKTSKRLASASMERVVNRKLCWDRLFASLCRQDKLCRCASLSRADAARSIEDTWEDVQDRQRWCQGHVWRSGACSAASTCSAQLAHDAANDTCIVLVVSMPQQHFKSGLRPRLSSAWLSLRPKL